MSILATTLERNTQTSTSSDLVQIVLTSLEESKAIDIRCLDVRGITSISDFMIICSGSVNRHVKGISSRLLEDVKQQGFDVQGIEGNQRAEWILIDLSEIIVHILLPETREFYRLEQLWSVDNEHV